MLLARGGRALDINDGLTLEQARSGSMRVQLIPSQRIKDALDSIGFRLVLAFCSLLGAGKVVVAIVDGDDGKPHVVVVQKPVVKLHVPVPGGGFIDAEVPATATLTLRKDGDVMASRQRVPSDWGRRQSRRRLLGDGVGGRPAAGECRGGRGCACA